MELNKKIYKYTSLISFAVVIMLIVNMIIPIFTKANTGDSISLSQIQRQNETNSLTITGTVPLDTESYKLYWVKGTIPYEMPGADATDQDKIQYQTELENWCESNNIKKEEKSGTLQINSSVELTGDGTYNVICIVTLNDKSVMIAKAEKIIADEAVFLLEATSVGKKITINTNSNSIINDIRVKKIDDLEDKDFDSCNNILEESEHAKTIAKEYTVNDYGAYKIKATNESGQSKFTTIAVCEEGKGLVINATAENNKININATSVILNIKTIKIAKSDTELSFEELETNGESITFTEGKNVTVSKDVTESGNYYVYAKDAFGMVAKVGPVVVGNGNTDSDDKKVDIAIELYRKTGDDSKTIHVKANSVTDSISFLKYYVCSEPLPVEDKDKNMEILKNSKYTIECNNAKSVIKEFTDSSISDDKYIYIYAETPSGACYYVGKDIKSIETVDTIPGEEEEVPDGDNNGDTEGDKPTGGDTEGDKPTGGDTEGDKPTGGDTEGDKPTGGDTEGDKPTGGDTEGDKPTGGDTEGDKPTGGDTEGDKPTGGDTEGDKPTGGNTEGDKPTGGDTEGDKPTGGNTEGDKPTGGNTEGDKPTGGDTEGDKPTGGNTEGDKPTGGNTEGDKPTGGNTEGNKPTGGATSGNGNSTNSVNTGNEANNNVITKPIDKDIPQTGENDTFIISMILVFSLISLGSYIKYKKIR